MRRSGRGFAMTSCGLLLALSACGGVGGDDDGGSGGGEGPSRITTFGFGLPDEHATARVDSYRAAHTDVDVRVNEGAYDDQQFLSAIAAGDSPDVLYVDRNRIGSLASRGAIQPIDDCISQQQVDMGTFREAAVTQVRVEDRMYGLPDFSMVRLMIVNNTAVREAGLTPEQVTATDWGALPRLAQQLTRLEGGKLTRIGFDPKIPDFLPMWAEANGTSLVSDDGLTPQLDTPEVIEATKLGVDLIAQQGGWAEFKAFKDSFDFFGANNQYAANQLGAMPMEAWYLNTLAANSPDVDVTVAPFTDRDGEPISYATGQAWAIPQGAPNRDRACEFIAHMTATDTWVTAAEARRDALAAEGKKYSGTYTANTEADDRIFADVYTAGDDPLVDAGVQAALSVQDSAFSLPGGPASYELVDAYQSAVNRVLNGQQSVEDALAQAQQEAADAIEQARG